MKQVRRWLTVSTTILIWNSGFADLGQIQEDIFSPSCATTGCHAGSVSPDLRADKAFDAIVNRTATQTNLNLVTPFEPENSYLMKKVDGTDITGSVMPPSGPLSGNLRETLRRWIQNGAAQENQENSKDTDMDGVNDGDDNCPGTVNPDQSDNDRDGTGDNCDPDADGDKVSNEEDKFPLDPNEWADSDGDGIGNNADTDNATKAISYLMTSPNSINRTFMHVINSSNSPQKFTGNLYGGDGSQVGKVNAALHEGAIPSNGRIIIESSDLLSLFNIDPWSGPALLEISGSLRFEVMTKLRSPSGLVSNTNCVRQDEVDNLEALDSANETYIRFINIGNDAITNIRGTVRDAGGKVVGQPDAELITRLNPKQAIWLNREQIRKMIGDSWNGTASLKTSISRPNLRLLNLNFVNGETFFNFSCFESEDSGHVYLITNSESENVSETHVINTGEDVLTINGTLYSGEGEILGSPGLIAKDIAPGGRAILSATDLEQSLNAETWKGPALLEITGNQTFNLMTKLTSPSGLVSNTNCVRQGDVHNIQGSDSPDMTYVRFINQGNKKLNDIKGTLYDQNGQVLGNSDQQLLASLEPRQQVWINRKQFEQIFGTKWAGEATLVVRDENDQDLRLLNLNYVNEETFFNFSCYESTSSLGATDDFSFFVNNIADQIIQDKCVNCHEPGGRAAETQLVYEKGRTDSLTANNYDAIKTYVESDDNNADRLLEKVRGAGHGGGVQLQSGSKEYKDLVSFLSLLGSNISSGNSSSLGAFWNDINIDSPANTLRRAAIILSGQLPTKEEAENLSPGTVSALRNSIKSLMKGPGFHNFLVRSANDRLHTDAFMNGLFQENQDINVGWWFPIGAKKYFDEGNKMGTPWPGWVNGWQWGMARAPLELIAFIVENDRSYQEVVTADYMMMNPIMSEILRGGIKFNPGDDHLVYKPGRNKGQIVNDDQLTYEYVQDVGTRMESWGNYIDYPHAGVLNSHAFLNRYPTTDTNRNRARARWTYFHFLGVDIEKSASRTTDPEALADTDNPTMNNPACTVCHEPLDPVAGAFQNYGNDGRYRDQWMGKDSLPDTYKYPESYDENAEPSDYQPGDTWFRDMRPAGFDGGIVNNADHSLPWLGERIANDPRFATATIKFWWPAIMGSEVANAPEENNDTDYSERLALFEEQNDFINKLGQKFINGIGEGKPFNGKDLLTELILSPWFRATGFKSQPSLSSIPLRTGNIGTRRLLTPEELESKTESLLGWKWGDDGRADEWEYDSKYTELVDRFGAYYGTIDSNGTKERPRALNALMVNVAERQAMEMACPAVVMDFVKEDEDRFLFQGIDPSMEPDIIGLASYSVDAETYSERQTFTQNLTINAGQRYIAVSFLNDFYNEKTGDRNLMISNIKIADSSGNIVLETDFSEYNEENLIDGIGLRESDCGDYWFNEDAYKFWSECSLEIPFEIIESGTYQVSVTTWGEQAGPDLARISVAIKTSDPEKSQAGGALAIKNKLVDLYEKFHGIELNGDDPEIEIAYLFIVETWRERKTHENNDRTWRWPNEECRFWGELWETHGDDKDLSGMKYSWTSFLIMLMTDFNYMHE
ncbi:MAG: hypothetical protein CMQ40_02370 [Gammaproteobacteria bacterium]|nr:hypothetical protein [Gammaproteobacteria bacterium]